MAERQTQSQINKLIARKSLIGTTICFQNDGHLEIITIGDDNKYTSLVRELKDRKIGDKFNYRDSDGNMVLATIIAANNKLFIP